MFEFKTFKQVYLMCKIYKRFQYLFEKIIEVLEN